MALYRMIDQVDYVPPSVVNPSVTPPIDAIVGRCLRRNPAQRYPSASALSDALAHSPSADLPAPPPAPRRWMKRIRWPRLRPPRAAASSPPDSPAFSTTALLRALRQRLRIRPAFAVGILSLGLLLWLIATLPGPDAPTGADMHEMVIRVTGPPATVYVDGRRRGTTPYRLRARIGAPIELELRRDGYRSKSLNFTMPATRSTFQETLSPLP
jgi:serine/threonine protein kinase